ncbi:PCI-domain-containing protein [Leucogyrophana mollusca]|uniref:PCI-domain-containing protein n=1 Tax=Leucogyrophana mollusca TaxID=85980 RepID=A0ACB8B659_9AGAM|nr:PCI-domain-containing protein [Leucogyrophana mollusca]
MEVDTVDVDLQGTSPSQSQAPNRRTVLPIDDEHPFDLDAYIAGYTGRTAVDRLLHIIPLCPAVAPHALKLAVTHIHSLRDPNLYQAAIAAYEFAAAAPDADLPPVAEVCLIDTTWLEETARKNQAERTKLEVELKTYSNNMIKESIRMGHRDLGDFYRSTGDYPLALKHYSKSREYCSTSQHVLDMCLSVLELVIEQRNYAHISSYIFKAEAALESASANAANNANNPATTAPAPTKKPSPERDQVQAKLDFAMALSHLGQGNYEKAAVSFLKVGSADQLGDWISKLVAPGDIAIYGTLCALSSLSRPAIKAQLLANAVFSLYIEQESYVRDLVQSYMASDFKTVLELLARYSTRHQLDIHLAPHVGALTSRIRTTALVLYLRPFATLRLARMGAAFGWTLDEVEAAVVRLIEAGEIEGRVDSRNKILKARTPDPRAELFAHALRAGSEIQSTNRKLLLRMRL